MRDRQTRQRNIWTHTKKNVLRKKMEESQGKSKEKKLKLKLRRGGKVSKDGNKKPEKNTNATPLERAFCIPKKQTAAAMISVLLQGEI